MAEPTLSAAGSDLVASIRSRFPALRREVDGTPVAFFDGPGGTQVPASVADAIRDHMLHHNGNAGWNYPTSHETDAMVASARDAAADLLGARPEEVAFGASMTTLTLRLSRSLGRSLEPGDRVVLTELEHHANVDPWRFLATERGAEIRVVPFDPATGLLDMDDLARAVDGARILAIGAASNALGTIPDVARAARLAHDAGALVFVDAVHYAPHQLVDVADLGADFLAASPYKFYGPHSGILWGRRELLEGLELPRVSVSPNSAPERVEAGTPSFEAIAGIRAAIDFIASIGDPGPDADPGADAPTRSRRHRLAAAYGRLHQHGEQLFARLWEGIGAIDGVTVFGPPPGTPRTPTLGFVIQGVHPRDAAGRLADRGLFLSHGNFYAATVIERLGFRDGGILRAGCAAYTTVEEVDRLVEATSEIAAGA